MRLHQLLHSAAPREITAIIELGFASCDYCINLHSAAPRAINSVRFAYITPLLTYLTATYYFHNRTGFFSGSAITKLISLMF